MPVVAWRSLAKNMMPVGQQSSSVERNAGSTPRAADAAATGITSAAADQSPAHVPALSSPSRFMPLYSRLRHARLSSPGRVTSADSLFSSPARTTALPSGSASAVSGLEMASPFAPFHLPEFPPEIDEFEEGASLPNAAAAPVSFDANTAVLVTDTRILSLSPQHAPSAGTSVLDVSSGIGTHPPPPSPRTPRREHAVISDGDSDDPNKSSPLGTDSAHFGAVQPQFFDSLSPVALKSEFDAASLPIVPAPIDSQAVSQPLAEPAPSPVLLIPPPDLSKFAPRFRPWSALLDVFSRIRANALSFVLVLFAVRAMLWAMRGHRLRASGLLGRVREWVRWYAHAFRA